MNRRVLMIANGRGAGRAARWPVLQQHLHEVFAQPFEVAITSAPGQATELAREGIKAGYHWLVAIGGDGTINEVVNGFFAESDPFRGNATLGILPQGTGNDFIRTLGIPKDLRKAAGVLARGRVRRIDVAIARYTQTDGRRAQRHFINVAEFGLGGLAVERFEQAPKILPARARYYWAILRASYGYRNQPIVYSVDDRPQPPAVILNFVVANGCFFGAGLCPAPHAALDDGLLDIIAFGDINIWDRLRYFPQLLRGTHFSNKKVSFQRGRKIQANSEATVGLELDGDWVGRLPAEFEVVPGALSVCVP